MLRRQFLNSVVAGSAAALCASRFADGLAYADAPCWEGVVKADGANVRNRPSAAADLTQQLEPGAPVKIDSWVAGSEVYPTLITWGHLADGSGYVYGSAIQPRSFTTTTYVLPADTMDWRGPWIDVNLTQNIVAACEGQTVRGLFPTSPGRPGWETTRGKHTILSQSRVQDMSGPGYYVAGVQWVSYFLRDGEAIHARTWDVDAISFGVPSSHGCLGVSLDAAAMLYKFASLGTPVYVHD